MPTLFDPVQAGELHLANRIVMAPLTRNRAPGAVPTPLMAEYYRQRASAGLIISEATAITPQAQGYADVPGLYGTEQLDGWRRVTQAVHDAGGKIAVQLWHVGRVSHVELQPNFQAPVAPSAIRAHTKTVLLKNGQPVFVETSEPRALDVSELPGIVQDYRHAARNALGGENGGGAPGHPPPPRPARHRHRRAASAAAVRVRGQAFGAAGTGLRACDRGRHGRPARTPRAPLRLRGLQDRLSQCRRQRRVDAQQRL